MLKLRGLSFSELGWGLEGVGVCFEGLGMLARTRIIGTNKLYLPLC